MLDTIREFNVINPNRLMQIQVSIPATPTSAAWNLTLATPASSFAQGKDSQLIQLLQKVIPQAVHLRNSYFAARFIQKEIRLAFGEETQ